MQAVDPVDVKAVANDPAKPTHGSVMPKEIMEEDVKETSIDTVDQSPEAVEQTVEPVKTDKEINFERLRNKLERVERELEEKNRILEEQKKVTAPVDDIGDDDFVEGRQFKSIKEKTAYLEKRQMELENQIMLKELYSKYPDIDEVVSKENLELLKELEPEIHESLRNTNVPPKVTYINAYKHVKNYVLKQDESKPSNMKDTQIMKDPEVMAERIAQNQRKSPSIQKASQSKKAEDIFYSKLDRPTKESLVARRRAAMKKG